MSLMTVRVLYKYRYVGVHHVATMIRAVPRVCSAKPYIDCIIAYNEAADLCAKFADICNDGELKDPDVFLARVEELDSYNAE